MALSALQRSPMQTQARGEKRSAYESVPGSEGVENRIQDGQTQSERRRPKRPRKTTHYRGTIHHTIQGVTQEERSIIRGIARDPRLVERIVRSIAPSIYGHEEVKMALACSLFGGCAKDIQGRHRIRGDINCLLLGTITPPALHHGTITAPLLHHHCTIGDADMAKAKSQLLKYMQQVVRTITAPSPHHHCTITSRRHPMRCTPQGKGQGQPSPPPIDVIIPHES